MTLSINNQTTRWAVILVLALCASVSGQAQTNTAKVVKRTIRQRNADGTFFNDLRNAMFQNDTNKVLQMLEGYKGDLADYETNHEPLLLDAIRFDKAFLIDPLLKKGASPNRGPGAWSSSTPLDEAINYRRWAMALKLVDAGADLNATNYSGEKPLERLVSQWWPNDPDIATRLTLLQSMLAHGADPLASARPPYTMMVNGVAVVAPTHSIVEGTFDRRDPALAELLLTNNASPLRRTAAGDTALHLAAGFGETNIVKDLLALGFSIDQTNGDGLTPLQMLAGLGYRVIGNQFGGSMVFWGGAVPPGFRTGLSRATPPSLTDLLLPFHPTIDQFSAAGFCFTNQLAAILGKNPAAANSRDGIGRTPLHYSIMATNADAFHILLEAHADPNVVTTRPIRGTAGTQSMSAGTSPLHLAVQRVRIDSFAFTQAANSYEAVQQMVTDLIDAKANVNATNAVGDTPLHLAAGSPTKCVPLLIKANAALNVTNADGKTPLRIAVEHNDGDAVSALFAAGAKPELGVTNGTLLHIAAAFGSTGAVVRELLGHGFKVDCRDTNGRTPFIQAAISGHLGTMIVLQSEGADINARDNDGNTALHHACRAFQDMSYYSIDPTFWERQKMRAMSTPGIGRTVLSLLTQWKWVSPPRFGGTNGSPTVWLLDQHAVITTNRAGEIPLHLLCQQSNMRWNNNMSTNRLQALLRAGARIDALDAQGMTCLHIAYTNSTIEEFTSMLTQVTNLPPTLLHFAASHSENDYNQGEGKKFALLISRYPDLNVRDKLGNTPMHSLMTAYATNGLRDYNLFSRHFSTMKEHGAKLDIRNNDGLIPPLVVLTNGMKFYIQDNDINKVFLDPGWDYSTKDRQGNTALHLIVQHWSPSYYSSQQFLRELMKHADLINLTNNDGDTAFMIALRTDNSQFADILGRAGVDATIRNKKGESTYLYIAQREFGNFAGSMKPPGATRRFCEAIASHDLNSFEAWLKAEPRLCCIKRTSWGQTPLQIALRNTDTTIAERLIALGAEEDIPATIQLKHDEKFDGLLKATNKIQDAWLFQAIMHKNARALQKLIEAGGNVNAADHDGDSLLYHAQHSKQSEVAAWLKEKGCRENGFDAVAQNQSDRLMDFLAADPTLLTKTNAVGRTLLMRAAARGNLDVIKVLLAKGADINARGHHELTALHMAVEFNHVRTCEMLLNAGADPNAMAITVTPLHIAAIFGRTNLIGLLLDHKANVNAHVESDDQYPCFTPLHWAVRYGHADAVEMLLTAGADPAIKGETRFNQDFTAAEILDGHRYYYEFPHSYDLRLPNEAPEKAFPKIKELLGKAEERRAAKR